MTGVGDGTPLTCAEMENLGPELAIGTLTGSERALALVHLETCARCHQMVDELAPLADSLLLLAPEAEPPIGFESRTAARIAAAAGPASTAVPVGAVRPRRRRLVTVAAAAFLTGALGAGALAWWAAASDDGRPSAAGPVVRTAVVRNETGDGRYSCHAMVVGTKPVWLYVSVTQPGRSDGQYRVEAVTGPTTTTIPIGTVDVRAGKGALGIVLRDVAPADITELRVFDAGGVLRYEAKFTTSQTPNEPTTIA